MPRGRSTRGFAGAALAWCSIRAGPHALGEGRLTATRATREPEALARRPLFAFASPLRA